MANYNVPGGNKKSIGMILVMAFFAIAGISLIVLGFWNDMLGWMLTFGVVILVISAPILVSLIYQILKNKIKDM